MILLPYPPVARRWKPTSPRPTTAWQRMATFQRQTIQLVATCRQTVEAYLATPHHRLAADGYHSGLKGIRQSVEEYDLNRSNETNP